MIEVVKKEEKLTLRKKIGRFFSEIYLDIKRHKTSYLMFAPFGIIFFTFTVLPVIISIFLSFTNYNVLQVPQFVGLENYLKLFLSDDIFLQAVRNTLLFALITGPIGYIAALLLAWFINELPPKIRAVVTLVFYAPSIAGSAFMIWTIMFSGDSYGYVNGWLMEFGIISEPIQWLQDPKYALTIVIIVALWMSMGAGFLSFIAGLQSVDKTLYEAGDIDGIKNRWQQLWFITLPSMKEQLMFGAVMSITSSFAASEITVQLCGFPSADYSAHTIINHLMDYGGTRFEMGYASSITTILFISMILINKLIQRQLGKVGR